MSVHGDFLYLFYVYEYVGNLPIYRNIIGNSKIGFLQFNF